jgi:hypothetical protein
MSGVYEIRKSVASLFGISPENLVDTTLYYYEPASVTEFKFTWGGREHYFVSLWEDTGEDGGKGQRLIMDSKVISGASYHEFAKELSSVKAEGIYRGDGSRIGGTVGSMFVRRMSPPYEETIEFLEMDAEEYAGVAYGGRILSYVRRDSIERLMGMADILSGDG